MTVVPLRLHRRPKTLPRNNSAYHCPLCWTPPLDQHASWCDEATDPLHRLAYPREARIFRGLPIALLAGVTGWVLFFAFLIWSLT